MNIYAVTQTQLIEIFIIGALVGAIITMICVFIDVAVKKLKERKEEK